MTRLGMNLTPPEYWIEQPFLDRMKARGEWVVQGAGWYCMVPLDSPGALFEARWTGPATLRIPNTVTTAPGRIVFRAAADLTKPQIQVKASGEIPIDLRIVRQDQLGVGGFFRPESIEELRGFSQIRFMDWLRTNEQAPNPKAYPRPTMDGAWSKGVPLEVCLALAQQVGARAWVNIPALATDDEIRAIGRACPPDADIEWSNEGTWNFDAGKWAAAQALAAKMDKAVWAGGHHARIAKVLESVGRKLVVGYQPTATNPGSWERYGTALIEAGATSKNVSRVMTSAYVYGGINSLKAIKPLMDADDVAGAVSLLRQDAIANSGLRFAIARSLADKLDGPWSVYEGNAGHLNTSNGYNTAVPFVAKIHMHPGMREVGEILLAEAEKHGCDVFNAYNYSSPATRYGFFGVKGTPFGALLDERRTAKPAIAASEPLTLESLARRVAVLEAAGATGS